MAITDPNSPRCTSDDPNSLATYPPDLTTTICRVRPTPSAFTDEQRALARLKSQARRAEEAVIAENFPPISNDLNEYWAELAVARGVKLPPNVPLTSARIKRFLRAARISLRAYYLSMGEPVGKGGVMEYNRLNPNRGMRQWAGQLLEGIGACERE